MNHIGERATEHGQPDWMVEADAMARYFKVLDQACGTSDPDTGGDHPGHNATLSEPDIDF